MKPIKIREIVIGQGMPKICVPLVGRTKEEIFCQAREAVCHEIDMVEWRADWFCDAGKEEEVKLVLNELRKILQERPLLFTIRTAAEGGAEMFSCHDYERISRTAAASGLIDLLDVEMYREEAPSLLETAHRYGIKVILSNHEFTYTPSKEEIIARILKMQEMDGDILKIAVMPQSKKDVVRLLEATEEADNLADRPVVTMSMAGDGLLSRLCGEIFGSAVTFGTVGEASAPGQIPVEELKQVLSIIHNHAEQGEDHHGA